MGVMEGRPLEGASEEGHRRVVALPAGGSWLLRLAGALRTGAAPREDAGDTVPMARVVDVEAER